MKVLLLLLSFYWVVNSIPVHYNSQILPYLDYIDVENRKMYYDCKTCKVIDNTGNCHDYGHFDSSVLEFSENMRCDIRDYMYYGDELIITNSRWLNIWFDRLLTTNCNPHDYNDGISITNNSHWMNTSLS